MGSGASSAASLYAQAEEASTDDLMKSIQANASPDLQAKLLEALQKTAKQPAECPKPARGMGDEELIEFWAQTLSYCLVANGWRSTSELDTMSADDKRNTVIVELEKLGEGSISDLQGMSDLELINLCPMEPMPLKAEESKKPLEARTLGDCLVANGWRSAAEVETMSADDKRNTVIVELENLGEGSIAYLQGMSDEELIDLCPEESEESKKPLEARTLGDCLAANGWRSAEELETMSADDKRNTVIVELEKLGEGSIAYLQGMSDEELINLCPEETKKPLEVRTLGDCLAANGWRSAAELEAMSADDKRNTVIVELEKIGEGSVPDLQGMGDEELIDLASRATLSYCLVVNGWRSTAELERMSADDKRNTVIVELEKLGEGSISYLQGMSDNELIDLCP